MNQGHKPTAQAPFKPPGLQNAHPNVPFPSESSIWEVYVNEAVVIDNELVKDWTSSLNFLLVFAAIFSSVLSAFIIESKQMLEQNPVDVMVDALIFFINNTANGTHTPYSTPSFTAPSYAVSVNCLFFASLIASIVAALASVVSLQWVAEYDAAVSRSGSSPEDRANRRQFRYGGMEKWMMKEIIAALPVLLYCSLVLFFVGLTQWIWGVHKTVGGVVLGGTLLGGAFYLITTLLAVVFPSCPYRAPIVRWIYVFFHFLFHSFSHSHQSPNDLQADSDAAGTSLPQLGKLILKELGHIRKFISDLPTYIIEIPGRFKDSTIQQRDQVSIKSDQKNLVNDSLAWLAQNISISPDSHHRLLLLAQEASKLDKEQQSSKQFKEIRWSQIFRLLGDKYAQESESRTLTEQDERGLTILLRCLRNPRIGPFIAPGNEEEYPDTIDNYTIRNESLTAGLNPVYLLLRNIRFPSAPLSIEEQVTLRTGCLNQAHLLSPTDPLRKDLIPMGTADICGYLVPRLARELVQNPHDDDQDRVNNLICLAHLEQPLLDRLPVQFGGRLSVSESPNLMYRLRCAHWIHLQTNHPHIHMILEALHEAQKRNPNISFLWRFEATDEEVTAALAMLPARQRRHFWHLIRIYRVNPRYLSTLEAFDELIARGCNSDQLNVMMTLICKDLEKASLYPNYFDGRMRDILALKDPALQLCGLLAAEMYQEIDKSPLIYTNLMHPLRIFLSRRLLAGLPLHRQSHRLQMRFWREMEHTAQKHFVEQVLGDIDNLKHLASAFTQPDMGIDHGGDFLLQTIYPLLDIIILLVASPGYRDHGYNPPVPVHHRLVPFQVQGDKNDKEINGECTEYLLELVDSVKRSPSRLIRLLIQLAKPSNLFLFRNWVPLAVDLYHILNIIKIHCFNNDTSLHIVDVHELADLLTRKRDAAIEQWNLGTQIWRKSVAPWESKSDFSAECTEVIHRLVSPKLTTFGLGASRSIACARPLMVPDAAVGWLGVYDGEIFRPRYIYKPSGRVRAMAN